MTESADRLFAIGGAIVIFLSLFMMVIHEDVEAGGAKSNWQVSFPESSHSETEDGNLNEGDSDQYDYEWLIMNITVIEFTLTWNDNDGLTSNDDTFRLEYNGPDGQAGNAQGSSGSLTLTEVLSEPPETFRVDKATKATAQNAADEFASDNGMGNWTVTVTLTSVQPFIGDNSENYDLDISVSYFTANIAELTGNEV